MTNKLNTSVPDAELYGKRGQNLSTWEGRVTREKAIKTRNVNAATKHETEAEFRAHHRGQGEVQ